MRIIKFIVPILILLTFNIHNAVSAQTRTLKPLYKSTTLSVIESGNTRTYYKLETGTPAIILVKGPGKLKVATRAILRRENEKTAYSIEYSINGGANVKVKFDDIHKSSTVKFRDKSNGIPGIIKVLEIELASGDNSIEFKSPKNSPTIIARYSFNKIKEKKLKWVMLSPSTPSEPVDLVTRESVVHYYRFSEIKPLKIKINGPTELRILTRFENHYDMKGSINYRIQVKENGKIIHTYLLSSVYSEITTYKKNTKSIPGKAREFVIQVPSGRHNYTIIPLDKDKSTILARVLFPKKDVKLEE